MPTRSIQVRLIVPRGPIQQHLRRALWATHAAVNDATSYYEQRLLLLRGEGYQTGKGEVPVAEVREGALRLAREAQEACGCGKGGSDEEVLALLRHLYEQIVPSAEGGEGSRCGP